MWRKSTLQHFDLGAVISSLLKTPPLALTDSDSAGHVGCIDGRGRGRVPSRAFTRHHGEFSVMGNSFLPTSVMSRSRSQGTEVTIVTGDVFRSDDITAPRSKCSEVLFRTLTYYTLMNKSVYIKLFNLSVLFVIYFLFSFCSCVSYSFWPLNQNLLFLWHKLLLYLIRKFKYAFILLEVGEQPPLTELKLLS